MEQKQVSVTPAREDLPSLHPGESQQIARDGISALETPAGPAVSTTGEPLLQPLGAWNGTSAGEPSIPRNNTLSSALQGDPHWRLWREAAEGLPRIRIDTAILGGIPVVRDTRISVAQILDTLTDAESPAAVVQEFPGRLEVADIYEVLSFAARLSRL